MGRLAEFLRTLRDRARLSQIQASHAAGLSETYYGKIESGSRRPSGPVLMRLLDVFQCSAEERRRAVHLLTAELIPGILLRHLDGIPAAFYPPEGTPPVPPSPGPDGVAAGPSPVRRLRTRTPTRVAAQRRHWTRTVRPFVLALATGWGWWLGEPLAIASPRPITNARVDLTGSRDSVARRRRAA